MRERIGRREGRQAVRLLRLSYIFCSRVYMDEKCRTRDDCHVALCDTPADEADEVVVDIGRIEVDF